MKTEIVSSKTTHDKPKPRIGQLWRYGCCGPLPSGYTVYMRIADEDGRKALEHTSTALGPNAYIDQHKEQFYSVELDSGHIVWTSGKEAYELLQPLGGEPLKLEVVL